MNPDDPFLMSPSEHFPTKSIIKPGSFHAAPPAIDFGKFITIDEAFFAGLSSLSKAIESEMEKAMLAIAPIWGVLAEAAKQQENYARSAHRLMKRVPGLEQRASCPVVTFCGYLGERRLDDLIIHLNDFHRMPREEIADWLETLPVDLTVHDAPTEEGTPS